ncbi:Transcription factor 12 [Lamellibrachia satsuma]|nr:Transcription factor 12 [Lamellibrachia satsuma]
MDTLDTRKQAMFCTTYPYYRHLVYMPGKLGAVYSPNPEEFNQDSARYPSPKPGGPPSLYSEYSYPDGVGGHGTDPWTMTSTTLPGPGYPPSSMLHGSSQYSQPSSYGMHHARETMGYHPMSPNAEMMPGLPPMSSFRGGSLPPSSTPYTSTSPAVNSSEIVGATNHTNTSVVAPTGGSPETGDALGKALASIYSTDHTSSSYGSNPSTPVSSPPPMSGPSSQWTRPTHSATSPHFESHLHSLQTQMEERLDDAIHILRDQAQQSRMEERLDDAIHVLRNHAEGGQILPPGMMPPPPHSNGLPIPPGAMGYVSGIGIHAAMDSHMVAGSHASLAKRKDSTSRPDVSAMYTNLRTKTPDEPTTDGGIKVEKLEKAEERRDSHETPPTAPEDKPADMSCAPSTPVPESHKANSKKSDGGSEDDDDCSPETKAERERVRRQANNARERLRVRDINEAFKELGHMVSIHMANGQPLTKLMVLQQAVTVITSLEQQVRGNHGHDDHRDGHRDGHAPLVRVRDINEAFKELGRMCSIHLEAEKPQTKLTILQQAVNIITNLEQQVRERNLNPKAACLKRREEEKTEELPGRGHGQSAAELAQQAALAAAGKVWL